MKMKNLNKYLATFFLVGSLLITTLVAQAKTGNHEDETAVTEVAVTLKQAVDIATKAVLGSPSKVEFESEEGKFMWEVEVVVANGQVYDFIIDATSGKVLKKELDKVDNEDEEEEEDDQEDDETNKD